MKHKLDFDSCVFATGVPQGAVILFVGRLAPLVRKIVMLGGRARRALRVCNRFATGYNWRGANAPLAARMWAPF